MYSIYSPLFGSITFAPSESMRDALARSGLRPEEIHHALGQLGMAVVRECERRESGESGESDTLTITP